MVNIDINRKLIYYVNMWNCLYIKEVRRRMALSAEARKARAAYMREWRRKNPGKQKEYDAKKWERKAEMLKMARQEEKESDDVLQDV